MAVSGFYTLGAAPCSSRMAGCIPRIHRPHGGNLSFSSHQRVSAKQPNRPNFSAPPGPGLGPMYMMHADDALQSVSPHTYTYYQCTCNPSRSPHATPHEAPMQAFKQSCACRRLIIQQLTVTLCLPHTLMHTPCNPTCSPHATPHAAPKQPLVQPPTQPPMQFPMQPPCNLSCRVPDHWPAAGGLATACAAAIDGLLACATLGATVVMSSVLVRWMDLLFPFLCIRFLRLSSYVWMHAFAATAAVSNLLVILLIVSS